MSPRARRGLGALLAVATVPVALWADGGLVRLSQRAGPFTVTVFSAPTPLRAGPIDVSVLIQEEQGDTVVDDATVTVTLRDAAGARAPIIADATRAQATNKLLYAAQLDLPTAGAWRIEVAVARGDAHAALALAVDADQPLPPWRAFWPYLALPFAGSALYALHQWLALRRG